MKNILTTAALLFSMTTFAQVGINNTSPKATLDITPKTTDGSKPEGLLIPQLDGNSLKTAAYGTSQKGVIVYAKSAASPTDTKTVNVTAEGYYYYDGSVWQKMTGISSGDTTNDAWINDTTNGLVKLGTKADGTARAAGTDFVIKDNGQVGIGTSSPSSTLEINSGTANTSGLKFTNLNSASPSTSNASTLGVDNSGNVVVQSAAPVQTKFKSFTIDSNVATNSLVSLGSLEFRFAGTCTNGSSYIQVRSASGANNLGIVHGSFTDNQSGSGFVNVLPTTISTSFADLTSYPLNCVQDGHAQFSFFSYTDRTYYRVNVHIADGDGLGFGALGYIYVEYQK